MAVKPIRKDERGDRTTDIESHTGSQWCNYTALPAAILVSIADRSSSNKYA